MENQRILLAGFLIVLVWFVWQSLFSPVLPPQGGSSNKVEPLSEKPLKSQDLAQLNSKDIHSFSSSFEEKTIVVNNGLFQAEISNKNGGSFINYQLLNYKGSYNHEADSDGVQYSQEDLVRLIYNAEDSPNLELYCNPCLEGVVPSRVEVFPDLDSLFVGSTSQTISFKMYQKGPSEEEEFLIGEHVITVNPDSYLVNHEYRGLDLDRGYNLIWKNGVPPAERYYWMDDQSSYAMYLNKDGNSDYLTGNQNSPDNILTTKKEVDWVATRNLFFLSAIIPASQNLGASVDPLNQQGFFNKKTSNRVSNKNQYNRYSEPSAFNLKISFNRGSNVLFDSFLAPLDYSLIKQS